MNNRMALFSHKRDNWPTPDDFFQKLNDEFHFTLDPCADSENHKCEKYFDIEHDGLKQSWRGERVFCNPPYGKQIGTWCKKAYEEVRNNGCQIVVMLVHARTDTRWFHDWVYGKAELRFVKGRLHFGGKDRAPFPSLVAIYTPDGKKVPELKEVSKEEFEKFLKEYPGRLNHNFYMGWYQMHDADTLEEVAKVYSEYGPEEYWIKE